MTVSLSLILALRNRAWGHESQQQSLIQFQHDNTAVWLSLSVVESHQGFGWQSAIICCFARQFLLQAFWQQMNVVSNSEWPQTGSIPFQFQFWWTLSPTSTARRSFAKDLLLFFFIGSLTFGSFGFTVNKGQVGHNRWLNLGICLRMLLAATPRTCFSR